MPAPDPSTSTPTPTAEKKKPDTGAIVESIGKHAEMVRKAAAGLTERIQHFQTFLGNLPGRVETLHFDTHPDSTEDDQGNYYLALKLHREGKDWILSYSNHHEGNYDGPLKDLKPLVDAPLKLKVAAVRMFPNLLDAVLKSQSKLIQELLIASSDYDKFVSSLKTPPQEVQSLQRRLFDAVTEYAPNSRLAERLGMLTPPKQTKEGK